MVRRIIFPMVQGWTVFLARRGQRGLTLTSCLRNGAAHYFTLLSNLWLANVFQSLGAAPGASPATGSYFLVSDVLNDDGG